MKRLGDSYGQWARGFTFSVLAFMMVVSTINGSGIQSIILWYQGPYTTSGLQPWPAIEPELPELVKGPISAAIEELEGRPAGVSVSADWTADFGPVQLDLCANVLWVSDGRYIKFEIELSTDIYSSSEKALKFSGPLSLLGYLLEPPEVIQQITGFECTSGFSIGGKVVLCWDTQLGRYESRASELSLRFWYSVRTNILRLFMQTVAPGPLTVLYDFANLLTGQLLNNLATATGSIGCEFTFAAEDSSDGISSTVSIRPYATFDVEIPSGDIWLDLVEFSASVEASGEFTLHLDEDMSFESFDFSPQISISFHAKVLCIVLDLSLELISQSESGQFTSTSTELRNLVVADGTGTCTAGSPVSFEATLTDVTGAPIPSQTVTFQYQDQSGTWHNLVGVTTNSQGVAYVPWTCTLGNGTYPIRATFAGLPGTYDSSHSEVGELTVFLDLTPLRILDLGFGTAEDYLVVRPGETVHISTYVSAEGIGQVIGIPIDFYVSSDDRRSWTYIGTDITAGWGHASIDWVVPANLPGGNHYFRAAYQGDYTYAAAVSEGEIRLVIESVKIVAPVNGAKVGTSTPTVTLDISAGVTYDKVAFRVDSDSYVYLPSSTTQWTTYQLSEGAHIIRAYLYQGSELKGTDYVSIEVDAEHPLVISYPAQNGYVSRSLHVDWTWTGQVPVQFYELLVDGSVYFDYLAPGQVSVGFTILELGTHTVTINAHTAQGIEDESVTFTVDGVAPTLAVTTPLPGDVLNSNDVSVSWTAADDVGLDRFEFILDGTVAAVISDNESTSTTLYVGSGLHDLRVAAYDLAQHRVEVAIAFSVVTSDPCVLISTPMNGTAVGTESVEIDWSWYSSSSYSSFQVYVNGLLNTTTTSLGVLLSLDEGWNNVTVRGLRAGGGWAEDSVFVSVDYTIALIAKWITSYSDIHPDNPMMRALDFTGDGSDEILIAWNTIESGTNNDQMHIEVYTCTGILLLSWTRTSTYEPYEKIQDITPAQLDSDANEEFVVCIWSWVIAFDYISTAPKYQVKWSFEWGNIYNIVAGDLDVDGYDEIWAPGIYVLIDHDGTLIWNIETTGASLGGNIGEYCDAVMLNVDSDPQLEVLRASTQVTPATLYCGDSNGALLWSTTLSGTLQSYWYTAGDVDGDDRDEVIVNNGQQVVLVESNGSTAWAVNIDGSTVILTAVGDITDDGRSEIVVCTMSGNVTILTGTGALSRQTTIIGPYGIYSQQEPIHVTNIDNDPGNEIVLTSWEGIWVFDDHLNLLHMCDILETHWKPNGVEPMQFDGSGQRELVVFFDPYVCVYRITVDIEPPEIVITSPAPGSSVQSSFLLEWSCGDNDAVSYSCVYVDDLLVANTTGEDYGLTLGEGVHDIGVVVFDRSGNVQWDNLTIYVDVVPPTVSILYPVSGTNTSSGVFDVVFVADGHEYAALEVAGRVINTTTSGSFSLTLPDGSFWLSVIAYDAAGNTASDTVYVVVDTVQPVLYFINPVPHFNTSIENITVTWIGLDLGTGVFRYALYVNRLSVQESENTSALVTLDPGWNNLTVVAEDYVGHVTVVTRFVYCDTYPPIILRVTPSTAVYYETTVLAGADCSDDLSVDGVLVTVDGEHTFGLQWVSSSFGIEHFEGLLNLPGLFEGSHVFAFTAYDSLGNSNSTVVTVGLLLDTVPPSVSISSPQDGLQTRNTTVVVTWAAWDDHGLQYFVLLADSEVISQTNSTSCLVVLDEGLHIVAVNAIDFAGHNASDEVVVIVDLTGPQVSITYPTPDSQVSGSVVVEADIVEANTIQIAYLYVDGALISNDTASPWLFQFDTVLLPTGSHIVEVRAVDVAGNSGHDEIVVTVGTTTTTATTTSTTGTTATTQSTTTTVTGGNIFTDLFGLLFSTGGLAVLTLVVLIIVGVRWKHRGAQ